MKKRIIALVMAVITLLGAFSVPALAATPDTIKLDRFGFSGVTYESAGLGRCLIHQMYYD